MNYGQDKAATAMVGSLRGAQITQARAVEGPPRGNAIQMATARVGTLNEQLNSATARVRNIADRMFGGQPEEANMKDATQGPQNDLGVLEMFIYNLENNMQRLHDQVSRLDLL